MLIAELLEKVREFEGTPKAPDHPVLEGEKVLGVMTPDLQKLCQILADEYKTEIAAFRGEVEGYGCDAAGHHTEACNAASAVRARYEKLACIMWTCVQAELDVWSHEGSLAIREGWQVVEMQPQRRQSVSILTIPIMGTRSSGGFPFGGAGGDHLM